MSSLVLVSHISIDGLIAGPKGEFDNFVQGDESLEFVCGLTEHADAALFGRISFELLERHWPTAANQPGASKHVIQYGNWYNKVPKYVLSKTLEQERKDNNIIIKDDPKAKIQQIKSKPGKDILVFGSPTVATYLLETSLLDEIQLLIHPVSFGEGIPLFKSNTNVQKLELIEYKKLVNGIMTVRYKTVR